MIHLLGLWDVELLVRMLEKDNGLIGPTLEKKTKLQTVYFRVGFDVKTDLEDCESLASLSSTGVPLSSRRSGPWFSSLSRHINLSRGFPEARD